MKKNLFLLSLVSFSLSVSAANPKHFECSYQSSEEGIVVKSAAELSKVIVPGKNCTVPKLDWKKEYLYLYHSSCPSFGDKFSFKSFKDGKLTVTRIHQEDVSRKNPDVRCNNLAACGQSAVGIVLKRDQKVKTVETEVKTVPCNG